MGHWTKANAFFHSLHKLQARSLANSCRIRASRFFRIAISRGEASVLSNLQMLLSRALIASLSEIANRCLASRSLLLLPLAMGATPGATAVRQMLPTERAAPRTATLREMVPAKMAALRTQST